MVRYLDAPSGRPNVDLHIPAAEHLSSQQEPTTPAPEPKAVPIGETEQGQPSERVAHAIGRMYEHVTQHKYVEICNPPSPFSRLV